MRVLLIHLSDLRRSLEDEHLRFNKKKSLINIISDSDKWNGKKKQRFSLKIKQVEQREQMARGVIAHLFSNDQSQSYELFVPSGD